MSLTCGLCDKQIDADDTDFHLSGRCEKAEDLLLIIERDIERHGPITNAIEQMMENALGRHGHMSYLRRI